MLKVKVTTPNSKDRKPKSMKVNQTNKDGWNLDLGKIVNSLLGKDSGTSKNTSTWPTKASTRGGKMWQVHPEDPSKLINVMTMETKPNPNYTK